MEKIAEKIIEIDDLADAKIADAESRAAQLRADAALQAKRRAEDILKAAHQQSEEQRIKAFRLQAAEEAALHRKMDTQIMALDDAYEAQHLEIENEILERIAGEPIA